MYLQCNFIAATVSCRTLDGELLPLDGELLPLDGELLPLDGELLPLDGELLPLDGALLPLDGALLPPDGELLPPDGALLPLDGDLLPPEYRPQPRRWGRLVRDLGPPAVYYRDHLRRRMNHTLALSLVRIAAL